MITCAIHIIRYIDYIRIFLSKKSKQRIPALGTNECVNMFEVSIEIFLLLEYWEDTLKSYL